MDSNTGHSPMFLVFPPEITVPEYQSAEFAATVYPQRPLQKLLATKMKVFGAMQILLGIMNFSFGIVFLFTLEKPYPRFPFIFVSGYPLWGSALFINSGAFLIALQRKHTEPMMRLSQLLNFLSALAAIGGIVLLVFGFLLDQNYICGYSQESKPCDAITILFLGILALLMVFSIMELFISLSYSILGYHTEDCMRNAVE